MQNIYDYFSKSSTIFAGLMGETSAQERMEGREKKEKKGEMKVRMGLSSPFPFDSSFHSSLGPKSPPSVQRTFVTSFLKNHNYFAYHKFSLKLSWYVEDDVFYELCKFQGK
jgi:hypothetical protein